MHCQVPQILGPKCPWLIIYTVIVFQHETMVGLPHIHLFFVHWPTMHLIYTQCPGVEPICECGLKTEVRRSRGLLLIAVVFRGLQVLKFAVYSYKK